eukprot:jgi/Chrzof1/8064/UNPLg00109.t1
MIWGQSYVMLKLDYNYLPDKGLVLDRFLWVIRHALSQGLYVIIDYQGMGTEVQCADPQQFKNSWYNLWRQVRALPDYDASLQGRVILDLMNEPDSSGIAWQATGRQAAMSDYLLPTMDAINWLDPAALFMFEGCGQQKAGFLNWGDGIMVSKTVAVWVDPEEGKAAAKRHVQIAVSAVFIICCMTFVHVFIDLNGNHNIAH